MVNIQVHAVGINTLLDCPLPKHATGAHMKHQECALVWHALWLLLSTVEELCMRVPMPGQ